MWGQKSGAGGGGGAIITPTSNSSNSDANTQSSKHTVENGPIIPTAQVCYSRGKWEKDLICLQRRQQTIEGSRRWWRWLYWQTQYTVTTLQLPLHFFHHRCYFSPLINIMLIDACSRRRRIGQKKERKREGRNFIGPSAEANIDHHHQAKVLFFFDSISRH